MNNTESMSPAACSSFMAAGKNSIQSEDPDCSGWLPPPDQLVTHLKLLETFYYLRQQVEATQGLFGIYDDSIVGSEDEGGGEQEEENCSDTHKSVRHARWSVYVARAADRFKSWWECTILPKYAEESKAGWKIHQSRPPSSTKVKLWPDEQLDGYSCASENLPPIDVLMVAHAFMLNPRYYLEDCQVDGVGAMFRRGMPWSMIDVVINKSFEYDPGDTAYRYWKERTNHAWDNCKDSLTKSINCPDCQQELKVPWVIVDGKNRGKGYGEKDFATTCTRCHLEIKANTLRLAKFKRHLLQAVKYDTPMLGTINFERNINLFPNGLCLGMKESLLKASSMKQVRSIMDSSLENKRVKGIYTENVSGKPTKAERAQLKHMLQCYLDTHTRFSIDVGNAVMRQSTFVKHMHDLAWYQSPALTKTMRKCLIKYDRFFTLISKYPTLMAVPTLDVDLAWHTHQTQPYAYFKYSYKRTRRLINHDDKLDETNLSDGFAHTNKLYRDRYNELYSQCLCWYCEATREDSKWNDGHLPYHKFYNRARGSSTLMQQLSDSAADLKSRHGPSNSISVPLDMTKRKEHAKSLRSQLLSAKRKRAAALDALDGLEPAMLPDPDGPESESRMRHLDLAPYNNGAPFAMTSGMTAGVFRVNPLCMATHPGECGAGCAGALSPTACTNIANAGVGNNN